MDIVAATHSYETWLAGFTSLYQPDLDFKHTQMAKPFPFFRGTYYRWVQRWNDNANDLVEAPSVLIVGDLHIENYGMWRDAEGRLCWGVNDFDEVDHLPYTIDLVRLAASIPTCCLPCGPIACLVLNTAALCFQLGTRSRVEGDSCSSANDVS